MSLFDVGPTSLRTTPRSDLIAGWRSSDASIHAYTGQRGTFEALAPHILGPIQGGASGAIVTAPAGMPRFTSVNADGRTRLAVEGEGFGQEELRLAHAVRVVAGSLYYKVWPMYAPGANIGVSPRWLGMVASDAAIGGYWGIRRVNATWEAVRHRQGSQLVSILTEPGTAVFPLEVMVTLSPLGAHQLHIRDSSPGKVITSGTIATDIAYANSLEKWGNDFLYLARGPLGGRWWLEAYKYARTVHTFDSIAELGLP